MPEISSGILTDLGLQFCKENIGPAQPCDAPAVVWCVSSSTGWIHPRCAEHDSVYWPLRLTWDEVLVALVHSE